MCSVVGYIGKNVCSEFVMEGLKRLEYRGYDSAGFACIDQHSHRIEYEKAAGRLSKLQAKLKKNPINGYAAIGHTRWATHGVSNQQNAHPHFDCQKSISIVHNGIIENHHVLKRQLMKTGHVFSSQTDSEVIAHLIEQQLVTHKTFNAAVFDVVNKLEGAYAFVALMQKYPDRIIAARKRSPLCIGIGDDELFVASDMLAFAGKTNKVIFIPEQTVAILTKDTIELYDFSGKAVELKVDTVDINWKEFNKMDHEHYMLKEIYEQKSAIQKTVDFFESISANIWDHVGLTPEYIKNLDKCSFVGCGTSWHAARIAQFFFEYIPMIPSRIYLASEFRYMPFFPEKESMYLFVSQSGETADTLEALRMVNSTQLPTVALTNVASSTMVREAGGFLLTQAGREVAVASTKAFSTQITALYWFAHRIALEKGIINHREMEIAAQDLLVAAEVLENTIETYKFDILKKLAKRYTGYKKAIFLGRHVSYPFAMEAALKLKEIAYVFSQGYPAGELKHGPLALVDEEIPIFVFSCLNEVIYQKIVSNAQEAKARGGHVVAFAFEGQDELINLADEVFVIAKVKPLLAPLAMTGIMQFFVYAIADELDCPIDKPRNLAKSVTVE